MSEVTRIPPTPEQQQVKWSFPEFKTQKKKPKAVKQCCFYTNIGHRCKVVDRLERIIFLDPNETVIETWGCKEHVDFFIRVEKTDINSMLHLLEEFKEEVKKSESLESLHNSMAEVNNERKSEFAKTRKKKKEILEKFNTKITELRKMTCRHPLCRKSIDPSHIKCQIIIVTYYNSPRENFFYHKDCFKKKKLQLGVISSPLHMNQFTMEAVTLDHEIRVKQGLICQICKMKEATEQLTDGRYGCYGCKIKFEHVIICECFLDKS